ncbi:hypothetical protein FACS1894139_17510 [Planctomycetales bacterium]|nr:hypothetical protein FACS1894139_17510 [Planctomycetales bacterium]
MAKNLAKKIYSPEGDDWETHRRQIFPPERIALNDARAEIMRTLIKARQKAGLSQQVLSAKTGISQKAISQIETCGANTRLDTVVRYAVAVGLKKIPVMA